MTVFRQLNDHIPVQGKSWRSGRERCCSNSLNQLGNRVLCALILAFLIIKAYWRYSQAPDSVVDNIRGFRNAVTTWTRRNYTPLGSQSILEVSIYYCWGSWACWGCAILGLLRGKLAISEKIEGNTCLDNNISNDWVYCTNLRDFGLYRWDLGHIQLDSSEYFWSVRTMHTWMNVREYSPSTSCVETIVCTTRKWLALCVQNKSADHKPLTVESWVTSETIVV
jgi:hypothetical protein